jgi:hypothetical protein
VCTSNRLQKEEEEEEADDGTQAQAQIGRGSFRLFLSLKRPEKLVAD